MRISVALCTYNGERFLQEQLDSIAAQTRLPNEIVICDDRSSDRTAEIVSNFAKQVLFPVRFYINECRLGSTKNFERAMELCEGGLIAFADQDDVWHTTKLARIEEVFAQHPGLAMVFTDADMVDSVLSPLGYRLWRAIGFGTTKQRLVKCGRSLEVLVRGNKVTGATMVLDARFRNLVIPFHDDGFHDGWIALLISAVAPVAIICEPLIKYRQHANNQVGAKRRDASNMVEAAKKPGAQVYSNTSDYTRDALARLTEQVDFPLSAEARKLLQGRADFLQWRATLPRGSFSRLREGVKGLLSLGYFRFANGWLSFLSDVVRPD